MPTLHDRLLPLAKATTPINPELLGNIPYFDSVFHDKELWPILTKLSGSGGIAHIELKEYGSGDKIISKGQFDQMIYWIVKGSANVLATIKNQSKIVHKSEVGECIGELGVLRGSPRTTDVVAGKLGVTLIEIDWAIAEKDPELGKFFFNLLTINLADKLDDAYSKHAKIIANAIDMINEKTSSLINRNKKLLAIIKKHDINIDLQDDCQQEQALSHAIENIKESLDLLKHQESHNNLKKMGTWFGVKIDKKEA